MLACLQLLYDLIEVLTSGELRNERRQRIQVGFWSHYPVDNQPALLGAVSPSRNQQETMRVSTIAAGVKLRQPSSGQCATTYADSFSA